MHWVKNSTLLQQKSVAPHCLVSIGILVLAAGKSLPRLEPNGFTGAVLGVYMVLSTLSSWCRWAWKHYLVKQGIPLTHCPVPGIFETVAQAKAAKLEPHQMEMEMPV